MTRAKEIVIIVVVLLTLAFVAGCKDKAEANEMQLIYTDDPIYDVPVVLQEGGPIEQKHIRLWGSIPTQNLCPHCGGISYNRFCDDCGKERGNLPFIGVYCPKCNPEGKYASLTSDVTKICQDCSSDRTWKYIYEDWQTKPNNTLELPDDIEFSLTNDSDWYFVPYSVEPQAKRVLWIEDANVMPPPVIYCRDENGKRIEYIPKPEPNEPEKYTAEELDEIYKDEPALGKLAKGLWGYGDVPWYPSNETNNSLLDFIPTWPDYIELERDLIIGEDIGGEHLETITLGKGMKIYFKEDK